MLATYAIVLFHIILLCWSGAGARPLGGQVAEANAVRVSAKWAGEKYNVDAVTAEEVCTAVQSLAGTCLPDSSLRVVVNSTVLRPFEKLRQRGIADDDVVVVMKKRAPAANVRTALEELQQILFALGIPQEDAQIALKMLSAAQAEDILNSLKQLLLSGELENTLADDSAIEECIRRSIPFIKQLQPDMSQQLDHLLINRDLRQQLTALVRNQLEKLKMRFL